MARKYDRYGLNRQFKAKPCSKLYPFPYPLPFIDDYSAANVLEKASAETYTPGGPAGSTPGMYYPPTTGKRSREEVEESQRKRRATNAARKLKFPDPLGANVYGWNRGDTKMVLMAAAAPWAPLAAPLLFESGALTKFVRYRRRRQALRDSRAILDAMESIPEYERPQLGLAGRMKKGFSRMNRKIRKGNTILNFIDRFPIRY